MSRELLQQALDALLIGYHRGTHDVVTALREALAAPESEPVARVAEVHMSRYTIEWTNGPLPEGTGLYAAPPAAPAPVVPIDMVLHCPKCGLQHIDAPDPWVAKYGADACRTRGFDLWTNPPHRSHLCRGCGHIWRPADVPTNGVAAVTTRGKADSPIAAPAAPVPDGWVPLMAVLQEVRYALAPASEYGLPGTRDVDQARLKHVVAMIDRAIEAAHGITGASK